ncbi:MAG TPA: hypothetical protein VHX13_03600 [Acidobacteriaceae bacterium]|nr:hypothetical protein [Acidobacteriaceae bacterium]
MKQVKTDFESAPVSPKLKALLAIAGKVQQDGKRVTLDDIARAKAQGATDPEIHDTVLIAAAFCMYNRYVDGLGTWQPRDKSMYAEMGKQLSGRSSSSIVSASAGAISPVFCCASLPTRRCCAACWRLPRGCCSWRGC